MHDVSISGVTDQYVLIQKVKGLVKSTVGTGAPGSFPMFETHEINTVYTGLIKPYLSAGDLGRVPKPVEGAVR